MEGQTVVICHQRELGKFTVESIETLPEPIALPCGKVVTEYYRIGNGDKTGLGYHKDNLKPVIRVTAQI